ncbi:hypothetical protein H5410_053082 [Solanum commersonii]|uniref:Uncharacterized protein n=1 Tax=Solanum commersonii TaxID=4109 RepID=A0A9J5X3Y6_SOLCO|nr:hypothetical protein H5410_053082 [Solanum commersonii]
MNVDVFSAFFSHNFPGEGEKAAPPQPQQPPVHQPPIQEHTGEHMSLENWERLLQNHKEAAAVIQEIHRELHTHCKSVDDDLGERVLYTN